MKNLPYVLVVLFLCIHVALPAQEAADYAGKWRGYITQVPKGLADRYSFELQLTQKDGDLSGQATISMQHNPHIYGIMTVRGSVRKPYTTIVEQAISAQAIEEGDYWCLKRYSLKIKFINGNFVLEGDWASNSCGGAGKGFIHLEK